MPNALSRATEEEKPQLQLSLVQVIAAALASITSAVILSKFGVAGTYVGTAVGSVVSTTAVAIYSHTMRQARRGVRTYAHHHHAGRVVDAPAVAIPAAAWNRSHARSLAPVGVRAPRPQRNRWRARWDRLEGWFAGLPFWHKVALTAAVAFVAAIVAVVLFQFLSGQSLANLVQGKATHGKPLNGACVVGSCGGSASNPTHAPAPASGATSQPTREPSLAPTTQPTPGATPFGTPAATPVPSLAPAPAGAPST